MGDFCMKARFSVSQAPCDEVDANPKLLGGLNLSLHNDFLGRWRWSCGAYTAMLNSCSFDTAPRVFPSTSGAEVRLTGESNEGSDATFAAHPLRSF